MSTAVLDIDVERLPWPTDVRAGYELAVALVRVNGVPVGKVTVGVSPAGNIDARELREAVLHRLAAEIAVERLRQSLLATAAQAPAAMSATVVICTRERPDDLRRCLGAVTRLPDDGQEILVVDNRPETDATRMVAAEFPTVRYVREDRRGVNAARNRAFAEARGDVLAFVDDDAVVDAAWLRELVAPFVDPEVMCVNGLTMPLELETASQEQFESLTGFSRRGFHGRQFQWPPQDPLHVSATGAGANMALRGTALRLVGPFDLALGPGTPSESGDENEFYSRLLRAGYRIHYQPRALNWHRHRRSPEELRRVMHGYGVGVYAFWTRAFLDGEWSVLRHAWGWFWHDQAPNLVRTLIRPGRSLEHRLQREELIGCLKGPFKYLKARGMARAQARVDG